MSEQRHAGRYESLKHETKIIARSSTRRSGEHVRHFSTEESVVIRRRRQLFTDLGTCVLLRVLTSDLLMTHTGYACFKTTSRESLIGFPETELHEMYLVLTDDTRVVRPEWLEEVEGVCRRWTCDGRVTQEHTHKNIGTSCTWRSRDAIGTRSAMSAFSRKEWPRGCVLSDVRKARPTTTKKRSGRVPGWRTPAPPSNWRFTSPTACRSEVSEAHLENADDDLVVLQCTARRKPWSSGIWAKDDSPRRVFTCLTQDGSICLSPQETENNEQFERQYPYELQKSSLTGKVPHLSLKTLKITVGCRADPDTFHFARLLPSFDVVAFSQGPSQAFVLDQWLSQWCVFKNPRLPLLTIQHESPHKFLLITTFENKPASQKKRVHHFNGYYERGRNSNNFFREWYSLRLWILWTRNTKIRMRLTWKHHVLHHTSKYGKKKHQNTVYRVDLW